MIDEWKRKTAYIDLICPRCGAPAGRKCQTPSGRVSSSLHRARRNPIDAAYVHGYWDAKRDIAESKEWMKRRARAKEQQ